MFVIIVGRSHTRFFPIQVLNMRQPSLQLVEREIMQLYREKFNLDPLTENGFGYFTEQQQVERYAQNLAFWQRLLHEYDNANFLAYVTTLRYMYIVMKEDEARRYVCYRFSTRKALIDKITMRAFELVHDPNC